MKQFTFVVDIDRCIGCKGGCQVGCKLQNGTALTSREIPTELIWRASLPGGSR